MARAAQAVEQRPVEAVQQDAEIRARLGRHAGARVRLDAGLETPDVREVRAHAELVERPAKVGRRGHQTVELQDGRGRHGDRAGHRGQQVLAVPPPVMLA